MSTMTWTYWPIIEVLAKVDCVLGANRVWRAIGGLQEQFVEGVFAPSKNDLDRVAEQLKSVIGTAVVPVNEFLRSQGFDISLDEQGPGSIYAAAVFDLLLNWLDPGKRISWTAVDGYKFDAVKLKSLCQASFDSVLLPGHCGKSYQSAQITAENGDVMYLIKGDSSHEVCELGRDIARYGLSKTDLGGIAYYEELIFPMICLDHQPDISWLVGLQTVAENGDDFEIAQALQQTKVRLNHLGVRVESAVAVSGRLTAMVGATPTCFIIDQPFWMVIERPGLSLPLFVGYLDRDCWRDPGNLK